MRPWKADIAGNGCQRSPVACPGGDMMALPTTVIEHVPDRRSHTRDPGQPTEAPSAKRVGGSLGDAQQRTLWDERELSLPDGANSLFEVLMRYPTRRPRAGRIEEAFERRKRTPPHPPT